MESLLVYNIDEATYFIPERNKRFFAQAKSKFDRALCAQVIIWNAKVIKNRYGKNVSSKQMGLFLTKG